MSSKSGIEKAGSLTKKKQESKEWNGKLSNKVKAEVLATMVNLMSCFSPEIFDQFPEWLKLRVNTAMISCSIDFDELKEKHFTQLREYMEFLSSKYPNPKKKGRENVNSKGMSRKD